MNGLAVVVTLLMVSQSPPWEKQPSPTEIEEMVRRSTVAASDLLPAFQKLAKKKVASQAKWDGLWFDVNTAKSSADTRRDEKTGARIVIFSLKGRAVVLDRDEEGDKRVRDVMASAVIERDANGKERFDIWEDRQNISYFPQCPDKECAAMDLVFQGRVAIKATWDVAPLQVFSRLGMAFPIEVPSRVFRVTSHFASDGKGGRVEVPNGVVYLPPDITKLVLQIGVRVLESY